MCKISCDGIDVDGKKCEGIVYEGETSRSIAERFNEHLALLRSESDTTRRKSMLFEHVRDKDGDVNHGALYKWSGH